MKHIPVDAILPPIVPTLSPKNLGALRWDGHANRSFLGKTLRESQPWSRGLASFTLISTIFVAMLGWLGFLWWGMYSAARWLWQLI
jgi:hypothetical protein